MFILKNNVSINSINQQTVNTSQVLWGRALIDGLTIHQLPSIRSEAEGAPINP